MGYRPVWIGLAVYAAAVGIAIHAGRSRVRGTPVTGAPGTHPVALASAGSADAIPSSTFLVRHARIFDGVRVISADSVLVANGRIEKVGRNLSAAAGVPVVEADGDTLLPGLIDSHAHTFARDDLQQALVFGVTTELDMFTDYHLAATIRKEQAAGKDTDLADLRSAGTLVTAPGGHGTEYGLRIPTITDPAEAQAFVDARLAEGSDYIKIIYDDGSAYGLHFPTISKATMAAVVRAAHRRGKLAVAHIGSYQGAVDAIDAGVDGLMHLFADRQPAPDFGRFAARHRVFVVPTLTVLESTTGKPSGASLVSDTQLAPYLSPRNKQQLANAFPRGPGSHQDLANSFAAVRQLLAARVPLLAGTDAGNPGTTHGASIHRELELLVAAGLLPSQALAAATSAPARAFHLADRGRISAGFRADLLLVRGDPTRDIKDSRDIVAVWKLGIPAGRSAYRAEVAEKKAPNTSAPSGSGSGLVSDFEAGTAATEFGAGWAVSTDSIFGGKSTGEMRVVSGGAAGSKYSLLVTGEIVPGYPYPWAGAQFSPGPAPMAAADLSGHRSITFWARGDGQSYRVLLFAQSLGFIPAAQTFVAGMEWKSYRFSFDSFPGFDPRGLMGVIFSAGTRPGKFSFQIDDVRFE
ncbi:MAG TPA: amidohydrolase family protein [Candidatus Acidoferrales bacterium]|nr:amidohydrolase family protein [Candidatus Acidoferrales bacterium]